MIAALSREDLEGGRGSKRFDLDAPSYRRVAASIILSLSQLLRLAPGCSLRTGAERGFVLFYVPESTEADVVATRNFETTNLSLGVGFSRTIIRQVLERREPLMLDDAAADPDSGK